MQRRENADSSELWIESAEAVLSAAIDYYRGGNYIAAETVLRQIVEQRPDVSAAWHLRGLTARRRDAFDLALHCFVKAVSGNMERADYCADLADTLERHGRDSDAYAPWARAMTLEPDNPDHAVRLGALLDRLGRREDACQLLRKAAEQHPDSLPVRLSHAQILARTGRHAEAGDEFRAVLSMNPEETAAMIGLGHSLQVTGRLEESAGCYRNALIHMPEQPEAHVNLAAALRSLGDHDGAIRHCEAALALDPNSVGALNNLGLSLCERGETAKAIETLGKALQEDPNNAATLHNLGAVSHGAGRYEDAHHYLLKALDLKPNWPEAQCSLGNLLRETGHLEDAAAAYRAGLDGGAADFKAFANLGLTLLNLNKPHEAIAVYEKALALQPDQPDIRMSLGIAQLATGDFANGWDNYEARRLSRGLNPPPARSDAPTWNGEPLAPEQGTTEAKSLLIQAEQGFGDTLQFVRYVPLAARSGGRIVFECQKSLAGLMRSSVAQNPRLNVTVVPQEQSPIAVDYRIPLLSLPRLSKTELTTIPGDVPYLSTPPEKTRRWTGRLSGDGPAVGLAWSGNPARQDDWMRSCPPDALDAILSVDGIRYFGLQKDGPELDHPSLEPLGPDLEDFGDTAAVIDALDLVISVDTAVAHLAGALARPVWVMLGYAADWRYLQDRKDSPWYPTMRLFRAQSRDDWPGLTTVVAEDLKRWAAARRDA